MSIVYNNSATYSIRLLLKYNISRHLIRDIFCTIFVYFCVHENSTRVICIVLLSEMPPPSWVVTSEGRVGGVTSAMVDTTVGGRWPGVLATAFKDD